MEWIKMKSMFMKTMLLVSGMMFKVGQLAVSIRERCVIQIRRIKIQNGEQLLGVGKNGTCWVLAEDYEKYKKVA